MVRRVALIYDDVIRPETTGSYCLRALSQSCEVRHFRPDQLDSIPRDAFGLYLNIDDGLRYHLPPALRPCAWWVIDTHLDPEWAETKGREFDWVFTAQRDGAERLIQRGIASQWLPLACDPQMHRRLARKKQWDICFIGNILGPSRTELLALIQQRFPNTFVGRKYFEDFARTYSEAKIGFNRSVKDDINMRVFETLSCGTLLVTNDLRENGQEELFVTDKHLVTYSDPEELLEKLQFYLVHDEVRERIAKQGHAEVLARHTYQHRMRLILDVTQGSKATMAVTPVQPNSGSITASEQSSPAVAVDDSCRCSASWFDSIDFVIKSFLRPKALLRLLRSIKEYYPQAAVTVADDGGLQESTDLDSQECCAMIDGTHGWSLLSLPWAAGVSAGRNLLVDSTKRPFLLFLDDDFCFTADTNIERLLERLTSRNDIGVAAGICVDILGDKRQLRNSGGTFDLIDDNLEIISGAWRDAEIGLREYVPQFAVIRREVFAEVRWDGGIGAEHYDFLLQLSKSPWKVVQEMSVQIDHYPLTESLPSYVHYRFNYRENQQWLLRKWGLRQILQDGHVIVERAETETVPERVISSSPSRPAKDVPYFEFARPEVAALVPTTARRILDVGCGAGRLGTLLKQRQPAEITGLELNAAAAAAARHCLDRVYELNVEDANVEFPARSFDCVICADVLEHLREPAAVLARIRRWLTPVGELVISLPNIRHHSIVAGLVEGNWTYESAGLLDNDHVRFFTRREIEKLLFRSGFTICDLAAVPGSGHAEWVRAGRPGSIRIGALQIEGLNPTDAEEFFTYQYLIAARQSNALPPANDLTAPQACSSHDATAAGRIGLTSIIIVTFNQLPYTRECVESIRLRTDEPYELIFVDNGSTDGTPTYLQTLAEANVVLNAANRGFPAAVNQGLQLARGSQILLLNNDTVVSTGWLNRMLSVLERDPRVGLVGPCSNNVSGSQMVPVVYSDLACMDGFAWDWSKAHAGRLEETDRLIGFCLLIRRSVLEEIGGLDERFGIGCFEDDDLCLRAIERGWKAVIARDSFVHHYGSRSFVASGVDFARLMEENRQKFLEKWTPPGLPAEDCAPFTIDEAAGGGLLLVPTRRPRLSLCMIVRNNEQTIGPCLESIRPWVDEMIVIDTGSTDSTPDICRGLGAVVYYWAWRDDFSAARNESLKYATGEWIFWMDSDDTISEACGRSLRTLADGEHLANVLGYVVQVHCPGPHNNRHDVTAVDHVKLFRNRPELRFEHRIHEQILPAIRRLGGEVAFTDLYVVHSGADHTIEGRQRKLERDFKLLHLDLQERPDHPFVLFNLGMTHADVQQHVEAVGWLARCLEVSHPKESHVRKTYALLISSLMQLRDYQHAALACQKAAELYPNDKEIQFRRAMLAHDQGMFEEAARLYLQVLTPAVDRHFASVDLGLSGFKARHNLALVYEDMGRRDLAESEWRKILAEQPGYLAARIGVIECLIHRNSDEEAVTDITVLCDNSATAAEGFRMAARLAEARNRRANAIEQLERGLEICRDDPGLLRELARLLHSSERHSSALEILERLTSVSPNDASAWHNRGVVLGSLDRHHESTAAFSNAAALRSSHQESV